MNDRTGLLTDGDPKSALIAEHIQSVRNPTQPVTQESMQRESGQIPQSLEEQTMKVSARHAFNPETSVGRASGCAAGSPFWSV